MRLKQRKTCFVVAIILVDVGVKRSGVNQKSYLVASRRRISSMRRAVFLRPLRPAFAAMNRRRPLPKCDSMASLVTSEMVLPLLAASCLNRASS